MAKSQSTRDRNLKQAPAVLLPSVALERGGTGGGYAVALRRRETRERAMNAMGVVIVSERFQLPRQVHCVPETHAIQVLAPDRAAKPNAQAALLIDLVKLFPDTVRRLATISYGAGAGARA